MKDDRLYVRLNRKDKERLVVLSAPYGGISNWILARLKEEVSMDESVWEGEIGHDEDANQRRDGKVPSGPSCS